MSRLLTPYAIRAVARRQLASLLTNPLGYVFIFAFVVVAGAVLFLPDLYYRRDVADLEPLHGWMPVLLAVLLPAISMGAWAAEREGGTEELLLTMPLTVADAVIGKYLAVLAYFTLALLCSASNVVALAWIGSPDLGLVSANYLGWFALGAMFAGISLVASVLVAWPIAAFVIGLVACSAAGAVLQWAGFLALFDLGRMPLAQLLVALAVTVGAVSLAILMLSSRRWRPGSGRQVAGQVVALAAALVLCANLARIGARHGADTDLTSGGLTSLQPATADLLHRLESPVVLTAYLSTRLPDQVQARARALLAKLEAIRRASPDRIQVVVHRIESRADERAAEALGEYAIEPTQVPSDELTGRELVDVYLGVGAASGERVQALSFLAPGMSIEYELATLVRSIGLPQRPVLGIADGDFLLLEGSVPTIGGRRPDAQVVAEWRRQWDVVRVDLDQPVPARVQVLVVPQVSSFTQRQVETLHRYLWDGRPALLLQDSLPFFELNQKRRDLLPDLPRRHANGLENVEAPKAEDITPLWRALGIDVHPFQVCWSDYTPSHQLREISPKPFVWTARDQGGINDHPATVGIRNITLPYPTAIRSSREPVPGIELQPLLRIVPTTSWGLLRMPEVTDRSPLGGSVVVIDPAKIAYTSAPADAAIPWLAVAVGGTMHSTLTMAADDGRPIPPGTPSPHPLRAVVVSDLDFLDDQFVKLFRGSDDASVRSPPELAGLNNVQFSENLLDWLGGDMSLAGLRTSRPALRPLSRLQDLMLAAREEQRRSIEAAEARSKAIEDKIVDQLKGELTQVQARTDLDEAAKAEEANRLAGMARQVTEDRTRVVKEDLAREVSAAKERQRQAVGEARDQVRALSIGIPAGVLALLVALITFRRWRSERSFVPASRLKGIP